MIDPKNSMLLLEEANSIMNMAFWSRYIEQVKKYREGYRSKCYERGEKEFEKGAVEALNLILGYRDMPSLFDKLRDTIVSKAGVAG